MRADDLQQLSFGGNGSSPYVFLIRICPFSIAGSHPFRRADDHLLVPEQSAEAVSFGVGSAIVVTSIDEENSAEPARASPPQRRRMVPLLRERRGVLWGGGDDGLAVVRSVHSGCVVSSGA